MRNRLIVAAGILAAGPALAGSDYIRNIEEHLAALGLDPGAVDGEFDGALTAAIVRFQSTHELPADGRLTRETYAAIMQAPAVPGAEVAPAPAEPAPDAAQPSPAMPTPPSSGAGATPPSSPPPAITLEPGPRVQPDASPASAPASQPMTTPMSTPEAAAPPVAFKRVGFLLEGALEFGGDSVATVYFIDGSSQDVNGGQGGTLAGGVWFRPGPTPALEVLGTLGYKYVTTKASNADISLSRVVTAIAGRYWFAPGWWARAGGVYHSSISFDSGGLGADVDFDNALGWNAMVGWRWVGATYTGIHYTDEFGNRYNASNGGLVLTWSF